MSLRALALLPLLSGCIVIQVNEGNGVPASETRDVGAFDGVSNESQVDVLITEGEVPSVAVTCDENLLEEIDVYVDGSVLTIRTMGDWKRGGAFLPRTTCEVDVVTPGLLSLENSGSGDDLVQGDSPLPLADILSTGSGDIAIHWPISADELSVESTGSGEVDLDGVQARLVGLTASGSGDLSMGDGSADELDLISSGSGDILARDLVAASVHATLTGSGDAEVTATESLDATLTGSGDLTVWGAPQERDVVTSGSGDVLLGG